MTKTNFCYNMFTTVLVSVPPSSVKSSLPVLVLRAPSFLLKTGSLQAVPSKNIICNKEHLYATTYHYNKKENLSP